MEKLEKKIESIVENNGHYPELIASEVKDIAIAFMNYLRFPPDTRILMKSDDEIFNHFISHYYNS